MGYAETLAGVGAVPDAFLVPISANLADDGPDAVHELTHHACA